MSLLGSGLSYGEDAFAPILKLNQLGLGGIIGNQPQDPSQLENPLNPQLQQMQQQQEQNASNYQANMPAYINQQQNAATDNSRQALASQLAGTTANSNARGMLYGSYNQGQQAQATAQNQAQLQNTNANINTDVQNTSNTLNNQAIQSGLAMQQSQNQQALAAYQAALQQQQSTNGEFGAITGGAGKAVGLLAAL